MRNLNLIQTKIIKELEKIPENKRKLLESQIEHQNKLDLKEAKEEIWKRWRHKKGKITNINKTNNINNTKKYENKTVEEKIEHEELKLKRIEEAIKQNEKEMEEKSGRLDKKRRKEQHWEMAKWLVEFIDENKEKWERVSKEREKKKTTS